MVAHPERRPPTKLPAEWRYWLAWAVVVATMAYGLHRYFEYRNAELDRRLEELKRN